MSNQPRNPNLQLSFDDDELLIDGFAGGGGASTGVEAALGRKIDIAVNHDPEALAMHAANHPDTLHLCDDIFTVDIKKVVAGRKVGLAWYSPDCTSHSRAKGGKPRDNKSRGLASVVVKWARSVKPRVIIVENVPEFEFWCDLIDGQPDPSKKGQTFKRWVGQLRKLGYDVEWRKLRACDYGAPTIRERLFIVARCDGQPIVWPQVTHAAKPTAKLKPYRTAAECINWDLPCPSIFLDKDEARCLRIKRPLADATLRRIAKGVMRYVINAKQPFIVNLTHHGSDRNESLEQPFATITAAHRGEKALVVPTLIQTGYGERAGQQPRVPGLDKPLGTVVAGGAKHALVSTFLSYAQHGGANRAADQPLNTVTASRKDQNTVVGAFLAKHYGGVVGSDMKAPVGTVTSVDHHSLVTAFISSYYGSHTERQTTPERGDDGRGAPVDLPLATQPTENRHALVTGHIMKMRGTNVGGSLDEPIHTISAGGLHHAHVSAFLLKYFGTDQDPRMEEPMHTITSKHRFGLVTVEIGGEPYYIADIGMRMLSPAELFAAQGFPPDYIIEYGVKQQKLREMGKQSTFNLGDTIALTKTAQVRMCGNSVSPPPAEALVRAQFAPRQVEAAA